MWKLRETRKEMQILDHGVLSWLTLNISSLLIPNIHTYSITLDMPHLYSVHAIQDTMASYLYV
jgi:hypothetical protein